MKLTKEQEMAIMHDKGNVMVSASAGSGKTFVMIERLIRLIIEGKTTVDRVLAVTFTNLAASEMKEKLITAITKKITEGALDEGDKKRLKEQLADVPSSSICTFHSFCKDLIRNYFYELGLDASFAITDEVQAEIIKKKAIDEVFEELYASGDEGLRTALTVFAKSRNDTNLKKIIIDLQKFFSTEAYPQKFAERALGVYSAEGYERIKTAFFEHYCTFYDKLEKEFAVLSEELDGAGLVKQVTATGVLRAYCVQLSKAKDFFDLVRLTHGVELRLPSFSTGGDEYLEGLKSRLENLKKKTVNEAKYLRESFSTSTDDELKNDMLSVAPIAKILVDLYLAYDERYSALKREANVVDFSDLEQFALKLLDNPEICASVKDRYDYLFADEYQDTNGVQEEILSRIENDNLFMVGDVKQSIYAFRGCKPEIFSSKFERFSKGEGTAINLSANFRCSKKVLGCVNSLFGNIMTEETAGLNYRDALMQGGNGEDGVAELIAISKVDKKSKNPVNPTKRGVYSVVDNISLRQKEDEYAEWVAIARLVRDAILTPVKLSDGSEKKIDYKDIVVLMRSADKFRAIAEVLADNGIPVSYETKKQVAVFPETRMLISLLRIIDCAEQDVPTCAVMRGPIGGFTDEELARVRAFSSAQAEGRDARTFYKAIELYRESEEDELKEKLDAFYAYIDELRFVADFISVGELLTKVIRDKGLDLFYASCHDGKNKLKRINKLVSEAYLTEEGCRVKDFLDRIDSVPGELTVTESDGEDAVRLMSIHASKGLEFPVVIVSGLNMRFSIVDLKGEVIKDREYGVSLHTYDVKEMKERSNLFREFLKKRFTKTSVREEMRILYVALTRAKYRLYLTETLDSVVESVGEFDVLQANSYSKLIRVKDVNTTCYDHDVFESMTIEKTPREIIASNVDEQLKGEIAKSLRFVYPYGVDTIAKRSVTAVLKEESEPSTPVIYNEYSDGMAVKRGNAYHRYMELADFNKTSAGEISLAVKDFIASGLMTEGEGAFIEEDKLAKVLGGEIFHLEGEYFRELPFEVLIPESMLKEGGSEEEVLVQGIIDLIVFTPQGIRLIDYKVSGRNSASLKTEYAKQLELYAYAAEKISGQKVLSRTLVNLMRGEMVEV